MRFGFPLSDLRFSSNRDLSLHMATLAYAALILLFTLGNLLLGFGAAVYLGHGPKWKLADLISRARAWLPAKPAQKSPQSPH